MNCECGLEMKTGDELCPRCGKSHNGQWSAPQMTPKPCTWIEDADGNWHTGCQQIHIIIDGTPSENGYAYCPYCGAQIRMSPAAPGREEDEP